MTDQDHNPQPRTSSHDRYRELVAGHALAALEPEDEQLLLVHLAACAACSRDLIAQREALSHLAYAAEPVEPPAALLDAIRAAVRETDPDAFDRSLEAAGGRPVAGITGAGVAEVIELAPRQERRRRLETRAAKLVAAAASVSIAAIVGLGAWNVALHAENEKSSELSAGMVAALDVLKAEPGKTVQLRAPEDGAVTAVAVMHDGAMDLVTDGLAATSGSTRYVVWGQSGDEVPVALADFAIDNDRVDVVRAVRMPEGAPTPERLMISKESGSVGTPKPAVPQLPVYADGITGA